MGGDISDVTRATPVLEIFGTPRHLGPLGSGQIAKACNQLVVASTIFALGEATAIASRSGLDVRAMWETLAQGYAGSRLLDARMERLIEQDYSVSGPAKFMVKDLGFAIDEAGVTATNARLSEFLRDQFRAITASGLGELDISVTRAFVESLSS